MAKAQIGSLNLGGIPRIAAIIDEMVPVQSVGRYTERGADLFEIRIDRFRQPFPEVVAYVRELRKATTVPLIGTIRETQGNRNSRLAMFEAIIPLVDCIDIEIDAAIIADVVKRAAGKVIIVSEHDFDKTPGYNELGAIVRRALDRGADIIKIAAMATTREDVTRLLRFVEDRPEPMVVIAMGEIGTVSRLVAPLFGSLFTYGFTIRGVAPGQISLESLVDGMRMLFPTYDRTFDQFAQ
jgi:3-dehydroquinate dehydratase-1